MKFATPATIKVAAIDQKSLLDIPAFYTGLSLLSVHLPFNYQIRGFD